MTPKQYTTGGVVVLGGIGKKRGNKRLRSTLIQGALVSLNPLNGAVVAMEGGFDFSMNQYNHAMQAARQPGSGFKPFVYSLLEKYALLEVGIFVLIVQINQSAMELMI